MTNLIATILFLTNILETLDTAGNSKVRTETIVAVVMVPGWLTNTVPISTNQTRYVWTQAPLKPARDPLSIPDQPPLPPGAKIPEVKWYPILGVPNTHLSLMWDHHPPDPRVEFVIESSNDLVTWQERARQMATQWPIPPGQRFEVFRVGSTWRP